MFVEFTRHAAAKGQNHGHVYNALASESGIAIIVIIIILIRWVQSHIKAVFVYVSDHNDIIITRVR